MTQAAVAAEEIEAAPAAEQSTVVPTPPRPRVAASKPRPERATPPREARQQPHRADATEAVSAPQSPAMERTPTGGDEHTPVGRDVDAGGSLIAALGATGLAGSTGGSAGIGGGTAGRAETEGPGYSLGSAANPLPRYPPAARRRGIEGTVVLDVLVSATGEAVSVRIARSSGSPLLDKAAQDAITRWRFRPATRGGQAIEARAKVPVQFSLIAP